MKAMIKKIGDAMAVEADGTPQELAELWLRVGQGMDPAKKEPTELVVKVVKKREPLRGSRKKAPATRRKAPRKARGR